MADVPASSDGQAVATSAPGASSLVAYPPARQAYWALFIFALSLVVNFLDRGIINLLVEPIKHDLNLSDLQISLLMGFAFVVFYIILGFPIASLVDSKSRRTIIAFGLFCWSGMTALCGIAQNFWSFFVFRVGVGVGEACTGPATFSMLADLFPPAKLTRAIALMSFGSIAGIGLAQMIGAGVIQSLSGVPSLQVPLIGTVHNWQLVFFIVGVPGLLVAALMFTVKEPQRRGRMMQAATTKPLPWLGVLKFVGTNWKVYAPIFVALALTSISIGGAASWQIAFFDRTHGWGPVQAGYVLGLVTMITAPVGLMLGTALAEWYARRGFDDANLRVAGWVALAAIPFPILWPLVSSPWQAVVLIGTGSLIAFMGGAPINAALQVVTPNEMRGRVSALYLFIFNVIGSGLGPTFIASFTDLVFADEAKLRYSLALSAAIVSPIAAACYWFARGHYGRAFGRARTWQS